MKLFKRKKSPKQANTHKRNSLGAYDGTKAEVPLQQENEESNSTSLDVESKHSVEASSSTEEASMSSQEIGPTKMTHTRDEIAPAPAMKQDKDLSLDPKPDINRKKNFENPDHKETQVIVFRDETFHKAPTGEKVEINANESSADESSAPKSDSDIKEISNLTPRNIQINAVQDEASHQAPTDKKDEKLRNIQINAVQDEGSHKAPTGVKVEITANESSVDKSSAPKSDSDIKEISNLKPRNIQINAVQDEASHQAPTDRKDDNSVDESLKSQTKSTFMRFLRKGATKREPTLPSDHKALDDPLNTTIETSPSSDSTSDVAKGSLKDKKRKPPRSGPMEITNLNLSRLIRQKNSVKERPRPPEYKPLKSNRTRPPPMCMSKRNEEQFQKYVQRQNIGRKFRVKQQTRAF
jgi:hypothetical protein